MPRDDRSPIDAPPRVFISYSHDAADHAERVLALADRLRQEGVDAWIDQYEPAPAKGCRGGWSTRSRRPIAS